MPVKTQVVETGSLRRAYFSIRCCDYATLALCQTTILRWLHVPSYKPNSPGAVYLSDLERPQTY
jgi:hypothetical protein